MNWLRSKIGRHAWLALFALACQFIFTFGHIHLANIGVRDTSTITTGAPAGPAGSPSSPGEGAPSGLSRDFCALCSNINLASTMVLTVPPAVTLQDILIARLQWSPAAVSAPPRDHPYFKARGPPHA